MSFPETRAEAEKRTYGTHYNQRAYDPTKCVARVRDSGRWPIFWQCSRKCGFGPEGLYCRQHDPVAVQKRDEESAAKEAARYAAKRPEWHANAMLTIIRQIASGHNDPASLCREFIKQYDGGKS